MEAPLRLQPKTPGRRTGRRFTAVTALTTMVLLLSPAGAGLAGPAPLTAAPSPGSARELARLEKQASALEKEYRGELVHLNEATKAARKANATADRIERDLATARTDVRGLAVSSYMSGSSYVNSGLDTAMPVIVSADPQAAIEDAVMAEHLAWRNGLRVQGLQSLTKDAERARRTAQAKVGKVRGVVADLQKRRTKVKALLAKYQPEAPSRASAGRPDGGGGRGRSPLTGNYMTARMRTLYLAVDSAFGAFPNIGCHRPGDPLDHGSGRACDFMETTGGRMPSDSARAHGDRVAQYAISNASRYGVKYVIWRQRIYDMRSPGWRAMSNRGSVTANHYDHVHISVF